MQIWYFTHLYMGKVIITRHSVSPIACNEPDRFNLDSMVLVSMTWAGIHKKSRTQSQAQTQI